MLRPKTRTQFYDEYQPMIVERQINCLRFRNTVCVCDKKYRMTRRRAHRLPKGLTSSSYLSDDQMKEARIEQERRRRNGEPKMRPVKTLEDMALAVVDEKYGIDSLDQYVSDYTKDNLCIFTTAYVYRIYLKYQPDCRIMGVLPEDSPFLFRDPDRMFMSSIFTFKVKYNIYGNKYAYQTAGNLDKVQAMDNIVKLYTELTAHPSREPGERYCACYYCYVPYDYKIQYVHNTVLTYCLRNPCQRSHNYQLTYSGELSKEWGEESDECDFACTCWLQIRLSQWTMDKMREVLRNLSAEKFKNRKLQHQLRELREH